MSRSRHDGSATSTPEFEVEIKSGGRAYDNGTPQRAPAQVSPARAAAKAQAQRRRALLTMALSLCMAAIVGWLWLSNPNNFAPSDAVVRVNGEYITNGDVLRELDLTRATFDLTPGRGGSLPAAASVLEDLILRKLRVQDARQAGVTLSSEEAEARFKRVLESTGLPEVQVAAALEKYNLTLDDLRAQLREIQLVDEFINSIVVPGVSSDSERRSRINEWQTGMVQRGKIERLRPPASGPAPRLGAEAPDFTLRDLDGNEVKLSSLRGRPVMINFWATWCPPCRAEVPVITKMYAETHKADNYEILGVATQSDVETIQAFAGEFDMEFPVLPDEGSKITSLYHVVPIPTTFFVDEEGIIRHIQLGLVDRPLLEKWLLSGPVQP